jgi:AcrR family transcriptional regulator
LTTQSEKKRRPGRPKEPEKRQHLLTMARITFAEKGYDGARLQHIADAAGLSKPALFHHFPSKDALYEAVLDGTVQDLASYVAASSGRAGTHIERLRELAGNLADYFGSTPDSAKLLLREFVNGGPYTSGKGKALVLKTLTMASDFLASGMSAGVFQSSEPERLVMAGTADLLFYYGAHELADTLLGSSSSSAKNLAIQREEVIKHFCRLVAVTDDA